MRKTILIAVLAIFLIGAVIGVIFAGRDGETWTAYVKPDGLYMRSVKQEGEPVLLAEGTGITNPLLSNNRKWAAYLQEGRLVLHEVKSGEGIVVAESPRSFIFDNKNRLVVADVNGTVCRIGKNGQQTPITGEAVYQDLVLAPDGTLYAHAYEKLARGSQTVLRPSGIVREDGGAFVCVLEGRKQSPSDRDLGFAPRIAAFSEDGVTAYIFHCPQSASLSADGVPMGALDLATGVYTPPVDTEQVLLPDRTQLSTSKTSGELAVMLGFGRNMNKQKSVGILRPAEGSFRPVSGDGIGMMPALDTAGARLLYIAAAEDVNMEAWMNAPKSIAEVDLATGDTRTLSKETTTYLAPFYAEKDCAVIALRREADGSFSLVRIENDAETVLDGGIACDLSGVQYGQIPLAQFFSHNR